MQSKSLFHLRKNFPIIALIYLLVLGLLMVIRPTQPVLEGLRILLGLAFILFIPGYSLQAAIFPRPTELDTPERLALSFGLSLAIVSLVALLLDRLPWGIRPWPILISEWILVLLFASVASLRHSGLSDNERYESTSGLLPRLASLKSWERRRYIILAGTVLTGMLSAAAIIVLPSPAKFYTEFYILGSKGLAEEYTREAKQGDDLTVMIGITNHESMAKNYQIVVSIEDPLSAEKHHVAMAGPFILQPGETIEEPIHWQIPSSGQDQLVEFLLFIDDSPKPYRSLRLWLNVTDG